MNLKLLDNDKSNETWRETQPHVELLGILLTRLQLFDEVKRKLTASHFHQYDWVYRTMQDVDAEEELTFKGIGARCMTNQIHTLHELRQTFISETRLLRLIQQVKERHLSDNLRRMGMKLLEESDPTNANDMLAELQQQAYEMFTTDTEDLVDMDKALDEFGVWVEEIMDDPSKAVGLTTGLSEMDRITTGWHKGDLIVVGAWTSMGKSAFMIENVLRLHMAGIKCAVFSLEMSKQQIYFRMLSNLMNIHLETLRTGKMARELLPKFHEMKAMLRGIYIDDTRGVDCEYISDVLRRLKRTQGVDFVVVDYIQDLKEKGESNDNGGSSISRVCRKLRTAAQQFEVPVLALSQVTRESQKRQDKRPQNCDLAGSTGIETSADVIALLYRDEYYEPTPQNQGILEVNFTKQRNGKLGKVELFYDKDSQRITSLTKR